MAFLLLFRVGESFVGTVSCSLLLLHFGLLALLDNKSGFRDLCFWAHKSGRVESLAWVDGPRQLTPLFQLGLISFRQPPKVGYGFLLPCL